MRFLKHSLTTTYECFEDALLHVQVHFQSRLPFLMAEIVSELYQKLPTGVVSQLRGENCLQALRHRTSRIGEHLHDAHRRDAGDVRAWTLHGGIAAQFRDGSID